MADIDDAGPAPVVTLAPLPARVRAASRLARIDYADAHRVTHRDAAQWTPECWLRAMLDDAPPWLRRALPGGWLLLGLRHGPAKSAQHVLGWPIRESDADHIVLAATSRLGMPAELVLTRDGDAWLFATLVEHDNAAMAGIWRAIAEPHRRVVRHLLRSAATRLTAARPV
jgi:hypothetical protein